MKKFLLPALAILVAMGLIGGAFAYFQDTEQSTANSLEVGTLGMEIRNGNQGWGDVPITAEWTMSNMEPGVTTSTGGIVMLREVGSINPDHLVVSCSYTATEGLPTGDMDTVVTAGSAGAAAVDDFAKYMEITRFDYYNGGPWHIKYDGTTFTETVPAGSTPSGYGAGDWQITDSDGVPGISLCDFYNDPLDNLPPPITGTTGDTHFEMDLKFRSDAKNDFQGDTLTMTLTFTLNQHTSQ